MLQLSVYNRCVITAVLALFAKAPIPGQVKTRLTPALSPEEAAELYEAMLLDILDQHAGDTRFDRALWYTPSAAKAWFKASAPAGYRLLAQQGAGLAARMRHLFRVHADENYQRIVLRGTDSPTLPLERVDEAFAALDRGDLVLCPDRDGGYNLIGLRKPCELLFDLEMSNPYVLEQTCARAHELGLRVKLLDPHHDVDSVADLALLYPELSEALTPRILRWLCDSRVRVQP